MSCNGCGETPAMTKDQVSNLIQSLIDSGKLQGGLKTCDGEKLSAESKVLLCSEVADKVNELIKAGTIKVVTDVKIADDKLVVTDGTGTKTETKLDFVKQLQFDASSNKLTWKEGGEAKEASLPYLKGVATDKALVVTLPDGSTAELPKSGNTLTEDSFDDTIEKSANKDGKFGVKLKPNGGLERTLTGIAVKTGEGVTVDGNGAVTLSDDVKNKLNNLSQANTELANRVKALEDLLASFISLKDASGNVILGSIKPE